MRRSEEVLPDLRVGQDVLGIASVIDKWADEVREALSVHIQRVVGDCMALYNLLSEEQ